MTQETAEEIEREEIEMLLPWYAMGKLDSADAARVESYLARHPQMSAQLDLIRAERDETIAANEALGRPSATALDRLMVSLPATGLSLVQRIGRSALFRAVSDFLTAPTARSVQWAAVAAALLIVVQAAAITSLLVEGVDPYQTASGHSIGNGFGRSVAALVVFDDNAKASSIAKLLAEFDATIVDGPKPGGVYKIRLRTVDQSQAAQDVLLRRLAERRDVVRTVVPSKD